MVRGWRIAMAGILMAAGLGCGAAVAQDVDILAVFAKAMTDQRVGVARKTKPVDGRPAKVGEVVVTVIKGEGVESRSKPAEEGDIVIRNRCPATGNEEYLVKAARMKDRYGEPKTAPDAAGWVEYEPKGAEMRYFILGDKEGPWSFKAPWGEDMVAKPGDAIVQDPANPKDTYRIAAASFACTYNVTKAP
ncbi:hypothetical protein NK718_07560 [Alsobacter sp. SYSU M60028]|uniref:DUF2141 domain-containing protein n=1 Tax=Alsobacter ponti TaxID=2962936 RepID=A0ABT1LBD7_9HYPH|nr:hypothetical protein [Alsobacter ponti]MCP8938368.1 hypothetical protein [Alsobacter ponti]